MSEASSTPPSNAPKPHSPLKAWAQLVRLPNVFTVLADVSAAFLLIAHGPEPVGRFACILLSGVALYWAGMVLNDVFDVDKDRQERSSRPLASGAIPVGQARLAGWAMMLIGVVLAAIAGFLPAEGFGTTWLPAAISVGLAAMIVAYDGPLKKTPLAPVAMGGCRVLSFLLGASACLTLDAPAPLIPKYVLGLAFGFGVYIMGITTMARREAEGGSTPNIPTGFAVTIVGLLMIAFAPRMAVEGVWRIRPDIDFPMLIGLIALPVLMRGMRIQVEPTPSNIQNTIRAGILSIIPLAAAVALLGAGKICGLAVFALVVPAIVLSMRLRVT